MSRSGLAQWVSDQEVILTNAAQLRLLQPQICHQKATRKPETETLSFGAGKGK
jgi:hypothetical protein